jgi:hypothetical protein
LNLLLQLFSSGRGQPVGLFFTRSVWLFEALNPLVFKQPAQSAIERTGAHPDAAATQSFDVLQKRVAMAGLICETQQY